MTIAGKRKFRTSPVGDSDLPLVPPHVEEVGNVNWIEALAIVDKTLALTPERSVYSVDEVRDLMLDIRRRMV